MPGNFLCRTMIALLVLATFAGCKKEPQAAGRSPDGGNPGNDGTAAAVPASGSLVGKWKLTVVEAGPDMPKGLADSLKGATLDLRADHTFRSKNDMAGGYGGTWSLDGTTLTLTTGKDESSLLIKSQTLAVEGTRLARHQDGLTTAYERQPAGADAPVYKLTADQYIAESKKDEAAFKKKYKGVIIEVDGVVNTITTNFSGDTNLLIYGPPQAGAADPGPLEGISCFTIDKHPKVSKGQRVKVRGEGAETMITPRLVEVEIVETGPNPADAPLPDLTPPDVKLVPLEFKFGDMMWAIDAPAGATAKDFFGDATIVLGKGFGLRINMLEDRVGKRRTEVTAQYATHKARRLLIDKPDTILVETESASENRFMFAADRTLDYVDFGARSGAGEDLEFAPVTREQCLLAMKCLKTLRAKDMPTEPAAILKWIGVTIDPAKPTRAVLDARTGQSALPLLTRLPDLTEVIFDLTHLTDNGMKTVARIPRLEELTLKETPVTDVGLSELAAVPTLRKLIVVPSAFHVGPGIKGPGLRGLKALQALWVTDSSIDDQGVVNLRDLTALRDLRLGKGKRALEASSARLSNAAVTALAGMKDLEGLGIEGSAIDDDGLRKLAADHPKLTELALDDTNVKGAAFSEIAKLPLKKLSLESDALDDSALKALADCSTLETLNLANTKITDAGLAALTRLASVQELLLGGTGITDQGLAQVAKMTHLKSLDLSGTKITDAGLKQLYRLKDLYYVNTEKTAVTKEGKKAFEDRPGT